MAIEDFVRAFLAVYFTFVAIRYAAAGAGQWDRDHEPRIHAGPPRSRARAVRLTFNVFRMAIWVFMVVRVPWPDVDGVLGPIAAPAAVPLIGIALLTVAYVLVEYVHGFMGGDWRSGVSSGGADSLLTEGPFARCRNPIFAAVMIGQLGLALALPSLFTLLCLVVGVTMLVLQTGVEERALEARFGARYEAYAARVPRFLPRRRRAVGGHGGRPVGAE